MIPFIFYLAYSVLGYFRFGLSMRHSKSKQAKILLLLPILGDKVILTLGTLLTIMYLIFQVPVQFNMFFKVLEQTIGGDIPQPNRFPF